MVKTADQLIGRYYIYYRDKQYNTYNVILSTARTYDEAVKYPLDPKKHEFVSCWPNQE